MTFTRLSCSTWFLLLASPTAAFQNTLPLRATTPRIKPLAVSSTTTNDNDQYPPGFFRAIECAKTPGLCNVDELMKLADELEAYDDSCRVTFDFKAVTDDNDEDCELESLDRLDVADLLRTEGETIQRRDTMEFSNKFKERVEQQQHQEQQEEEPDKDVIDLYSNYYEVVYSKTTPNGGL